MTPKTPYSYLRKILSTTVLTAFLFSSIQPPVYAQSVAMPWMPKAGTMVALSTAYTPANLKGLVIHPDNALRFDFLIHRGQDVLSAQEKTDEYNKLIKYFLASLAVPDEHQWVNLSPYEKDRMIKEDFGRTEMGRDLLAQDYILKQMTASLIYPESALGQKFWEKVYAQAQEQFGTTEVPMNTFNKVWIVPDEAQIYEKGNTVYIVSQHLKVMLEQDYLSLSKHAGISNVEAARQQDTNTLGSQIVREIVLPALEKEVNEGKNFAMLRQIYSGMILSAWYKNALKESLLGKIYADRSRVKGVEQPDTKANQEIYQQYVKAFKKGVFNYIKEDVDRLTNQSIPRKYFSGGMQKGDFTSYARRVDAQTGDRAMAGDMPNIDAATVDLTASGDQAMTADAAIRRFESYDRLVDLVLTPESKQGVWAAFDIDKAGDLKEPTTRREIIALLNRSILRNGSFPAGTRFFATYESSGMPAQEEGYIHIPKDLSKEELIRTLDAIREEFKAARNWSVSFAVMQGSQIRNIDAMERSFQGMLRQAKGFPKGTAWSEEYGNRTIADGFLYPRTVYTYVNPEGIDAGLVEVLKDKKVPSASFPGIPLGAVDALAGVRLVKDLIAQASLSGGRLVLPAARQDEGQLIDRVRTALAVSAWGQDGISFDSATDATGEQIRQTIMRSLDDLEQKIVRQPTDAAMLSGDEREITIDGQKAIVSLSLSSDLRTISVAVETPDGKPLGPTIVGRAKDGTSGDKALWYLRTIFGTMRRTFTDIGAIEAYLRNNFDVNDAQEPQVAFDAPKLASNDIRRDIVVGSNKAYVLISPQVDSNRIDIAVRFLNGNLIGFFTGVPRESSDVLTAATYLGGVFRSRATFSTEFSVREYLIKEFKKEDRENEPVLFIEQADAAMTGKYSEPIIRRVRAFAEAQRAWSVIAGRPSSLKLWTRQEGDSEQDFNDARDLIDALSRLEVRGALTPILELEPFANGDELGLAFSAGSIADTQEIRANVLEAIGNRLRDMLGEQGVVGISLTEMSDYDVKIRNMIRAMREQGVSAADIQQRAGLYAAGRTSYSSGAPANYAKIDAWLDNNGYRTAEALERGMFLNDVARKMGATDAAMNTVVERGELKPDNVGGIDLNAANLNLRIKRDGKGVPLPLSQQDINQLNRIEGLVPVITQIKPAAALPVFADMVNKPLPVALN